MPNINIRRLYYQLRHRYLTMNNIVIAIAFFVAAGWAWGSIGVMQRNYDLQKVVDTKQRQAKLIELQTANLAYEGRYYQTDEYKKLAVRERLGLADPGEKVLVLPPNSAAAQAADQPTDSTKPAIITSAPASNAAQWGNFIFGGSARSLQE